MIQSNPSLTPDTIKARLMKTASKTFPLASVAVDPSTGQSYTDTYDVFTIGAGYVDVYAALMNQDSDVGYAYSPTISWNPLLSIASLLNPSSSLWNGSAFSLTNVWGTQLFVNGSSAAWGDSGLWGSSAAWGDRGIWGTSAAWGDSVNGSGEK